MLNNNIKSIIKKKIQEFFLINSNNKENQYLYNNILKAVEETVIEETLVQTQGIQIQAAKILGISRITLARKIKDYKLNCNIRSNNK